MPRIPDGHLIEGYTQTCGQGFDYPPPEFYERREVRTTWIRLPDGTSVGHGQKGWDAAYQDWKRNNPDWKLWIKDGVIFAQPQHGRSRPQIELGRFLGDRKTGHFVLNGDGFDNRFLQGMQAQLREQAENVFRNVRSHRRNISKRIIIPYEALRGARLDPGTIKIIHVSHDRWVQRDVVIPMPTRAVLQNNMPSTEYISSEPTAATGSSLVTSFATTITTTATGGATLRHQQRDIRRAFSWQGYAFTAERYDLRNPVTYSVLHRPEFAAAATAHRIREVTNPKTGKPQWVITERVHRLGASVFSAVGADGQRHRWISAFDQNEPQPMYFLAQLPDKGYVRYYTHAVKLLAPPIVHKAREDGKDVQRQGDIFAIETDLTDADFNGEVVCRDEIFDREVSTITAHDLQPGAYGTLTVDGRKNWRKRRRLQIYGTGHTATWVAVKPSGTFVKGVMWHDPILEDLRGNREPEHRPLRLKEGKWYLAVRNTVPRQVVTTEHQPATNIN